MLAFSTSVVCDVLLEYVLAAFFVATQVFCCLADRVLLLKPNSASEVLRYFKYILYTSLYFHLLISAFSEVHSTVQF